MPIWGLLVLGIYAVFGFGEAQKGDRGGGVV